MPGERKIEIDIFVLFFSFSKMALMIISVVLDVEGQMVAESKTVQMDSSFILVNIDCSKIDVAVVKANVNRV